MKRGWMLLLCLALLLCGCSRKESQIEGDCVVYLLDQGKTTLQPMAYLYRSEKTDDRINELFTMLMQSSEEGSYSAAIPSAVNLLNWTLSENGTLTCVFGPAYYEVATSEEVLMRAAIVKTLTQLDAVSALEFYVMEEPLTLNGTAVGTMAAEQFLEDVGVSVGTIQCTLYFANASKTKLVPVQMEVEADDYYTSEQLVLATLIQGPDKGGCYATVPKDTRINHIVTKDSICYVDLSSEFMNYQQDMPAELTIYSIVNSLAELTNVSKVVFTVEGSTRNLYINLDLSQIFERSLELVEE